MNKNDYTTYDLGLASALCACGCELQGLERDTYKPNKFLFVFKFEDKLRNFIKDYWDGNLEVNARKIMETQKMLKNRIYSN